MDTFMQLVKQFGGNPDDKNVSIDKPSGAITCKDHHALVEANFLSSYYGTASINEPANTVTAKPKMNLVTVEQSQFLMNPTYRSKGGSIDDPSFTLVARMDKTPPYLITTKKGELAVVIYKDDTEAMIRIKEFMAMFGIVDIKMRMLNVPELKRIMGFGTDYTLIGTQTEQKKYIGNAVEVNMSTALCEALAKRINE